MEKIKPSSLMIEESRVESETKGKIILFEFLV